MQPIIRPVKFGLLRHVGLGALLVTVLVCTTSLRATDRKPNFLFIFTDDHRWDAIGVVQREQDERARFPWFQSPNMDRLAAEGIRFRNAFVTLALSATESGGVPYRPLALNTLDELGLAEDTVVVYTSDNGYYLGEHCSGDKRSLYEESIRIPMLVRYPRLFAKGRVIDEMVVNIDLAPTFLDVAGIPVPERDAGRELEGTGRGTQTGQLANGVLCPVLQGIGQCAHLLRHPHRDAQTGEIPQPPRVDRGLRPD